MLNTKKLAEVATSLNNDDYHSKRSFLMSWRFRQSFNVVPGLRLNLSSRGLSASIGGSPLTLNVGPHGVTETLSIPGTGISYRHHESLPLNLKPLIDLPSTLPQQSPPQFTTTAPVEHIHSASTELLTSETLKELKSLIQTASKQRYDISLDLDSARTEKIEAVSRFDKWNTGFLFKRIFNSSFEKRRAEAETATDKVTELEKQLKLSTIATHIEIEKEQANLYYLLKDAFSALCESISIWDVKTRQATDQHHERTIANSRIERERVEFDLASCDLIEWEEKVPHIRNAKGGSFFLYPGFIVYRTAREAFSLIEYRDMRGRASLVQFHEEDGVPSDTKVIGQTWAKCNKDGSRDKRFANNHQIPIAQYIQVTLKNDSGLWEEFHFSNPQRLVTFLESLNNFTSSFEAVANG